ncbi:MAG: bifunctional metallophosphatase/5'-nucleotidase [Anaerolineales bacterium]
MRKAFRILLAFLLSALVFTLAVVLTRAETAGTVEVQILALNDFHGNLLPPGKSVGGVEYLAAHIDNLRQLNPNTVVVSAGDLIGVSPLLSALFHDEPTIEAFNLIGLDFSAVGNHEFDEGVHELLRMQAGGCHPVDGCQDGDGFEGADFLYLAANVTWKDNDQPVFPAYEVRTFEGVPVAFIGVTLEGTPTLVKADISEVNFLDEAEAVNALVPELKEQGIETIVALIHEGGAQTPRTSGYNECVDISGPIVDIVNNLNDEVDLVISGHEPFAYNCVIDDKVVTHALFFGRLLTRIDLTISLRTHDVVAVAAENREVTHDVAADSRMTALIERYKSIAAPFENRVVGAITADVTRATNAAGESALGDVIADAQLDATDDPGSGEAVVAFMNPAGLRADLTYVSSPVAEGDGNMTYLEIYTVQPLGYSLVTMTLTGAQIDTLLEQQFEDCSQTRRDRILQVSAGFTYSWSLSAPPCDKVDPATIMINGVQVDPAASYRVTVNSFLAKGGDRFTVFLEGTDRRGGDVDVDALEKYIAANSPVPPGPQDRITQVP